MHDRFVNTVVHHSQLLEKIILHNEFVNRAVSNESLLERIVLDDEFVSKTAKNNRLLEKFVLDDSSYDSVLEIVNLAETLRKLRHIVNTDKIKKTLPSDFVENSLRKRKKIIEDKLLDAICEKDKAYLSNGVIKFADKHSLWGLLNEILVNEDYFFETDTDSPKILDCGAHCGIAIYYFKNLYPKARITCFEPVPAMRELALENVRENGFSNVEILPYALADEDKTSTFLISNTYSMAGSLTERRRIAGDDIIEIDVECHRLSKYLQEPVHFLKLDIEGLEDAVLTESKAFLKNVQYLFCEYHHGMGLATDRLGKILLLLDEAGFDAHATKSFSFQRSTLHRPMTFVDRPYSAIIWAKNRNWT